MYRIIVIVGSILSLILCASYAFAHGGPPEWEAWAMRQHNLRGGHCCDENDTHYLGDSEWRRAGDRYEVLIRGAWFPVAVHHQLQPKNPPDPNPTHGAVAWYVVNGDHVRFYCFAPGYTY